MSDRSTLVQDALELHERGRRLYNDSRLGASVAAFRKASGVARCAGADAADIEDGARFWLGASLHSAGRLQDALAAWTPTVERLRDRPMNQDRYRALTRYLLVAVDIPLSLARIEAAFDEVEHHLITSSGGGGGLRSRVLIARARLALNRGHTSAGLEFAQEALARGLRESSHYSTSTYFRTVVRACLDANEMDMASMHLREWETTPDCHQDTKRLLLGAGRAHYLRRVGNVQGAARAIQPFRGAILSCEDVSFQHEAGAELVRTGEPERVRDVLACLCAGRHSSVGEIRFQTWLLMVDWHLERVGEGGRAAFEKACRMLDEARREAERLDALLSCERHSAEVEVRVGRLAGHTVRSGVTPRPAR